MDVTFQNRVEGMTVVTNGGTIDVDAGAQVANSWFEGDNTLKVDISGDSTTTVDDLYVKGGESGADGVVLISGDGQHIDSLYINVNATASDVALSVTGDRNTAVGVHIEDIRRKAVKIDGDGNLVEFAGESRLSSDNAFDLVEITGNENEVEGLVTLAAGASFQHQYALVTSGTAADNYACIQSHNHQTGFWSNTSSGLGNRICTDSGAATHYQDDTAGAVPVLTLQQDDVDEDFFEFIGTSDTNVDRALVDAADFTTPGSIVGWLKIRVQDDQTTNPIADGDYYIPFYGAPSA
ncbi:MAG: hypothetical protein GY906_10395 [bacterium]|nr:hypothetical protein [bacterium]